MARRTPPQPPPDDQGDFFHGEIPADIPIDDGDDGGDYFIGDIPPDVPTDDGDGGGGGDGQPVTIYAIAHGQVFQGGRWVDRHATLVGTFLTTDTVQDVQDYFAPLAEETMAQSAGVLVSVEVTAPAYFEYFQGF